MKPTHIRKNGAKITYVNIKHVVDATQIELAIGIMISDGETEISKRTIEKRIRSLLYNCGTIAQGGLINAYADWEVEAKNKFWANVKEIAYKYFPAFYKDDEA